MGAFLRFFSTLITPISSFLFLFFRFLQIFFCLSFLLDFVCLLRLLFYQGYLLILILLLLLLLFTFLAVSQKKPQRPNRTTFLFSLSPNSPAALLVDPCFFYLYIFSLLLTWYLLKLTNYIVTPDENCIIIIHHHLSIYTSLAFFFFLFLALICLFVLFCFLGW